jgi:hypothetical protein
MPPWTEKQLRVIQARRHGWQKGTAFKGVGQAKLTEMSKEGLRGPRKQAALLEGSRGGK